MRGLALAVAVAAVVLLGGVPAAAHVEVVKAQPNGDGTATLTFHFDHSCDASPTTELVIALPSGVTASRTTQPAGWSASLAPERVTYRGPGLIRAELSLVARIVARPGETLRFPALQRCANGDSYDWIDFEGDGEQPAPRLVVTGAILAAEPTPAPVTAPATAAGGGRGASLPQALAILVGFVIVAAGVGYLYAGRTPKAS